MPMTLFADLMSTPNPWWEVFGRLHPLVLHFPIVLIVLGAVCAAILWLLGRRDLTSSVVSFCLWGGFVGAVVAAWAGWTLADHEQETGNLVDLHRWFSVSVVVTMTLAAVFDLMRRSPRWLWAPAARLLALLVSAVLVCIAGHFGAEMKWGVGWVFEPLNAEAATADTTPKPPEEPVAVVDPEPAPSDDNSDSPSSLQIGVQPIDSTPDNATAVVTWAQIEPVLEAHCARCHGPDRQKAGLQLVPYESLFPEDPALWVVTPSKPESSELYRRISLPIDDVDLMPPDGDPMPEHEQALVEAWIAAGAPGPDGKAPIAPEAAASEPTTTPDVPADAPASPDTGKRAEPSDVLPQGVNEASAQIAVDALRARGVTVRPLHVGSPWLEVSLARVDPPVGDSDLGLLSDLAPVLWSLNASHSALTDAGMAIIGSCGQLRSLRLDHTAVGDAGVAHLSALHHLEVLNLFGTPVADAALGVIEGLGALKAVYLGNTDVTEAGIEQLRTVREELAVHGSASLPVPETK